MAGSCCRADGVLIVNKYYATPEQIRKVKETIKYWGLNITWQSVVARPDTIDDFLEYYQSTIKRVK